MIGRRFHGDREEFDPMGRPAAELCQFVGVCEMRIVCGIEIFGITGETETIAADHYRIMSQVERLFHLPESGEFPFCTTPKLVAFALMDSLESGTLNEHQRDCVDLMSGMLKQ
jgi:hypothetical protein